MRRDPEVSAMAEKSPTPDDGNAGGGSADRGPAGSGGESVASGEEDAGGEDSPSVDPVSDRDGHQREGVRREGDGPRVVGLESADAADVIGAVGSDTGRAVLEALHEEPGTASALADRVDCSLQTIQYHLGNLTDADLVDVVDETTSEKGREMDVYGPARRPVVVYAGDDDEADLRSMVRRLVPVVALLGIASLVVQELLSGEAGGQAVETAAMSSDAAGQASGAAGPEPGLVFFAGGLAVVVAYLGLWHLRRRGHLDGVLPGA